jgi:hypothetical protein
LLIAVTESRESQPAARACKVPIRSYQNRLLQDRQASCNAVVVRNLMASLDLPQPAAIAPSQREPIRGEAAIDQPVFALRTLHPALAMSGRTRRPSSRAASALVRAPVEVGAGAHRPGGAQLRHLRRAASNECSRYGPRMCSGELCSPARTRACGPTWFVAIRRTIYESRVLEYCRCPPFPLLSPGHTLWLRNGSSGNSVRRRSRRSRAGLIFSPDEPPSSLRRQARARP